jgi:uncharacterized membrane protein YkoI
MEKPAICSLLAAVLLLGSAASGFAAEPSRRELRERERQEEQDIAREAFRRGDVMPITRILAIVAQRVPGEVVEVKLETRRTLHYQLKVLTRNGVVREVHVDARSGMITREEDD